jgi:4-amino-4-deoxy-L-arabinose transferase-like glycosyltransferase
MTERAYSRVWPGVLAYLLSLLGTFLLGIAQARPYAAFLLVGAGVLAVIIWGRVKWSAPFALIALSTRPRGRLAYVAGIWAIGLLLLGANAYHASHPSHVFGLAGWLWLVCIGALVAWTAFWSRRQRLPSTNQAPVEAFARPSWVGWEKAIFTSVVVLAFAIRVWNLRDYPNNVYPDEISTGTYATQSFQAEKPVSVFSTVWGDVELPALWFLIVSVFLKIGGTMLSMLRLPAALFGAVTVVPFYLLMRETWGRVAAITATAILAFSASNVHYSRLGLNNIATQFFWVACFLFLLRGLRDKRPVDWALAGLSAGLSEYFYYGTRLLPFILAGFCTYLLLVHWREARRCLGHFALMAFGYLVGMGPLLAYFLTHPNLYLGRGAQMMVWNHIPTSLEDIGRMVGVLAPIISENVLGISTNPSQDIVYFGSLLTIPEAALLVLGVGLLVWKWKHPAAFLVLLSGLGVLFVGGSLVFPPNGVPPFIAHWTPAFPLFFCALAIPVGLWLEANWIRLPRHLNWKPVVLSLGLALLGWLNVSYYFGSYHADPDTLRTKAYRAAQGSYDIQVAVSRYVASLGTGSTVVIVGKATVPYDRELTRYLLGSYVPVVNVSDPWTSAPSSGLPERGVTFIFFPGNEQDRATIHARYPGGRDGIFAGESGKLAFFTYTVPPSAL